jgi:hypothetical protein
MSKPSVIVLIAVAMMVAAAVAMHFSGGGMFKEWMMALHGRH